MADTDEMRPHFEDIQAHYDLSDDFFGVFQDPTRKYSCAFFTGPDVTLSEAQIANVDQNLDRLDLKPGMTLTALTRGYTSVVLRGISTGISQATPSTAYYIDEAPIGSITAYATGSTLTPDLDPYDLRRVEVLKGPQGTLYGAGAVGGLLRYVTVPADGERLGGAFSLGTNKVSEGGTGTELRGSMNIPLGSPGMGLRVSLLDRTDAGYIDDPKRGLQDVNKATTRGGRVALAWKISPDWSLQTWALTQRFRQADEMVPNAGHIGMMVGRSAARDV